MPIPAQYQDALKTWLRNHAYKAVKTVDENWELQLVPDSDPEEYVKVITSTVTYLDADELLWRLRRKIIKSTPATEETLTLDDMHELFDPYLPTIREHLGVVALGGNVFDRDAIDAEDPDA
jgi:hypothetical protein